MQLKKRGTILRALFPYSLGSLLSPPEPLSVTPKLYTQKLLRRALLI